jgi:hypothetical protein
MPLTQENPMIPRNVDELVPHRKCQIPTVFPKSRTNRTWTYRTAIRKGIQNISKDILIGKK